MVHDPDDARDICQEAFLKVHKSLGTFEGDAQFFTWLYRIVVNLVHRPPAQEARRAGGVRRRAGARRAGRRRGIAPHRTGFDPARALADKELREQILAALDKLSPAHRAVLVMREVEGLSYQEMADTMKCSIGTIMSRLFHARKKMQTMLIAYRKAAHSAA